MKRTSHQIAAHPVLQEQIAACRLCPRLVFFREEIARLKRRAYIHDVYWGHPVPSLGDPAARLLIVGLAPGAHGANRTGRMFTGDRSGDFLYPTLFRFGFCTQPDSRSRDDGLELMDSYITAALHCVPPGNRPAREELAQCRSYLTRELSLLIRVRVVVALGRIAWDAFLRARADLGLAVPRPCPRFGHGVSVALDSSLELLGSYHPSQQNTRTGRLTQDMFDAVFQRARQLIDRATE